MHILFSIIIQAKLAKLKVEKLVVKALRKVAGLAEIPFNLANGLMKKVEAIVQVGLDMIDKMLKNSKDILQIHSFCINANLGKGKGLCVSYKCSLSLFKKKMDFDGNLCLNGNAADDIGK